MQTVMHHTILVVDDDPDDMELTARALRKSGFPVNCIGFTSGAAALARLHSNHELPSLMLLDLKMPGMDGIDTLRRIRADERTRRLPVIIVTNSTLESDRAAAEAAGADHFLHKAFDMTRYARDIASHLEHWLGPTVSAVTA
jgi:two-component system response regulator